MEAEDTVMDAKQFYDIWTSKFDEIGCRQENLMFLSDYKTFKCDYEIAKTLIGAQAEISFKAGYRLGLYDKLDLDKGAYKEGKQAGIREVVEWIDGQIKEDEEELRLLDMQRQPLIDKVGYVALILEEDRQIINLAVERTYIENGISRLNQLRQAKLKEWGIE